jgi:beta-glucanase (GH16 family)
MNQYRNFIFLLMTMAAVTTLSHCRPAAADVPAALNQNMPAVFFDDFSGAKLDTVKWNIETTGMHFNNELQAYVDSAATISIVHGAESEGAENGALQLKPKFAPGFVTQDGQKFDFISGRINTRNKVEVAYGTVSARIKITDGAGLWPAWWMLGKGNWPETGEIDIMEYIGEKDWASAAAHGTGYSGDAALVDRLYFPANNDITQWHIYAVDWTPDSLVFKYDGVPMFRVTKPMTQFFGTWAFDNPKFLILNFAVGGVYPFKINGIKSPYYGLSNSTFEAIKNNKSKMLVDWVKVIKRDQHAN